MKLNANNNSDYSAQTRSGLEKQSLHQLERSLLAPRSPREWKNDTMVMLFCSLSPFVLVVLTT